MNVNAAIIDQRLVQVAQEIEEQAKVELKITDAGKLKSLAFVFLCVKTLLDLQNDEAFDCLTEGGNDFDVDALHTGDEKDNEFVVTIFQGKYKQKLEGASNFEENAVKSMTNALRYLFDPSATLKLNSRLAGKIEEVRSRIKDGYIPQVRGTTL